MTFEPILDKVGRYYTARVREFGATARGADWNSEESQDLRFAQLARLLPPMPFSVVDYGCGYGALVDFLERQGSDFDYQGFDISDEMVKHAAQAHSGGRRRFTMSYPDLKPADYVVASGVFNVKLDTSDDEWAGYVLRTVETLDGLGRNGFAFNMLTSYSDPERMRADLYYADPCAMFDHCKRSFSRQVALLHDYGLYEFTILVRK
ncbi:MAG TPA: class I SAM-dependent methyltransferase [Candidatus Dormibacteraeota bacterium]|nr:class I SAM-dependent methyltransferase [Candidatus Dormibacteraeota bacterium]